MTITKHIGHALALLLLMSGLASCIYDKEDEPALPAASSILSLDVEIPTMRVETAGGSDGYEAGVDFENYIDLSDNGLRIFIFDSQNKYITRLIPMSPVSTTTTEGKNRYTVTGILPNDFPKTSSFKVVVLANWPKYNDGLLTGISTIDDLCKSESAQFDRLTDFNLSADNKIPFFGIHEYQNVTLTPGETTALTEDVTLLRAMAKIEVVFNTPGIELTEVNLNGINSKGFCAPRGIYTHTDYDHNGSWTSDYIKDVHLPGDVNDPDQANKTIPLLCKNKRSADGKTPEKWYCYVPEYRNVTGPAPDYVNNYAANLQLKMDFEDANTEPHKIYFTDYVNGKPMESPAPTYYDIRRNNLYRFTVTYAHGGLIIKVQKWDNAFDNTFTY